jgi:hypothetical protein
MTDTLDKLAASIPKPGDGAAYGPPAERRSTSQPELKRKAREQVARAAANGTSPSTYRTADLTWAFGDSAGALEELDRLEAIAQAGAEQKQENSRRIRAGERVRGLAEKIIADEDKQLADDRMAAAIEEAKRRLGIADEPTFRAETTTETDRENR